MVARISWFVNRTFVPIPQPSWHWLQLLGLEKSQWSASVSRSGRPWGAAG